MRKPNLFIIGAAKCATTSLHSYLATHPQIFMSYLKEPGYFSHCGRIKEQLRPFDEPRGTRWKPFRNDLESYLGLFRDAGDARVVGESSTGYSQRPHREGVAERIAEFQPDAFILYLMRDPVERTISQYWWHVQHENETLGLLDALRRNAIYGDLSHYAMQLEPYLSHFPAKRIKCLTMEALAAEPVSTVEEVFEWLGVERGHRPANLGRRENAAPQQIIHARKSSWLYHLRYSPLWNVVGPYVPKSLRSLGRKMTEKRVVQDEGETARAIDYLRPLFLEQMPRLRQLLGREFPEWKTLYGAAEQADAA